MYSLADNLYFFLQVFMNSSRLNQVKVHGCRSMLRTVSTARHVTLKIQVRILIGSYQKEAVDPLTMECNSL